MQKRWVSKRKRGGHLSAKEVGGKSVDEVKKSFDDKQAFWGLRLD